MHESWKSFLQSEFEKPYFKELSAFLSEEYEKKTIFPKKQQVFSAFTTDFSAIKVVILGQDPYHTPGAAHGLAFSVPPSAPIPPSLINIYKEIDSDLGTHHNHTGNLLSWQNQGVLLLNNVLTVEAHRAGSHRGRGWEIFTEATIRHLSDDRENLVFILWGPTPARKNLSSTPKNTSFSNLPTRRPFPPTAAFSVANLFRRPISIWSSTAKPRLFGNHQKSAKILQNPEKTSKNSKNPLEKNDFFC